VNADTPAAVAPDTAAPLGIDERMIRAELAGPRYVAAEVIERLAELAYERARLTHATHGGELPSPEALMRRLGFAVRRDALFDAVYAVQLGRVLVHREDLSREDATFAVAVAGAFALLGETGAPHTRGDAIALGLALLVPASTLTAARDEGDCSAEGLRGYRRGVPAWALALRLETAPGSGLPPPKSS